MAATLSRLSWPGLSVPQLPSQPTELSSNLKSTCSLPRDAYPSSAAASGRAWGHLGCKVCVMAPGLQITAFQAFQSFSLLNVRSPASPVLLHTGCCPSAFSRGKSGRLTRETGIVTFGCAQPFYTLLQWEAGRERAVRMPGAALGCVHRPLLYFLCPEIYSCS